MSSIADRFANKNNRVSGKRIVGILDTDRLTRQVFQSLNAYLTPVPSANSNCISILLAIKSPYLNKQYFRVSRPEEYGKLSFIHLLYQKQQQCFQNHKRECSSWVERFLLF